MVMTNGLQLKKQQSGPAFPEALESGVLSRKNTVDLGTG
jgi:hypothetical protein